MEQVPIGGFTPDYNLLQIKYNGGNQQRGWTACKADYRSKYFKGQTAVGISAFLIVSKHIQGGFLTGVYNLGTCQISRNSLAGTSCLGIVPCNMSPSDVRPLDVNMVIGS
jgi:hypothetical protein